MKRGMNTCAVDGHRWHDDVCKFNDVYDSWAAVGQLVERRTRDLKAAGSIFGRSGRRNFFGRFNVQC